MTEHAEEDLKAAREWWKKWGAELSDSHENDLEGIAALARFRAQAREAAEQEARNWKADALLRAQNSDYWKGQAEAREKERDEARASVKRWEDKEARAGHLCYIGEEEAKRAEAAEARVREVSEERDRHWNSCKALESHLMEIRRQLGGGHQSEVLALPDDVRRLVGEVRELRAALGKAATHLRLLAGVMPKESSRNAAHGFADEAEALLARTETPKG